MKVLHILGSDRFSGAENVACQIIAMFSGDADLKMAYCSRDGQIREALAARGVDFYPIPELSAKALKKVINEINPDVLHAHDMRASFVAVRAARGKIPVISHIHGNSALAHGINVKTLAYRYAAKRAKHIIWVSKSSLEDYRFRSKVVGKSTVLGNVVSISEVENKALADTNEYEYDAVFVGRLVYEKNPLKFLRIINLVKEKLPRLSVCVLGDGYLQEDFKAEIENLGLSHIIQMRGFVENPMKIMRSSSVMIISSVSEGLPMCALEAMALGVPIVSTPIDGLNSIIENGVNGYLSDNESELAELVVRIISDKEKREEMSQNARVAAKKINNQENYKDKLREIYGI